MGIKGLTKLLAQNAPNAMKEHKFESYFGREIAIDASMSIYQFLIVVGRRGTQTLTNEAGEVTSHLQGMLTRTIRLLEAGIKPVYVFDGTPPDLKKEELAKRVLKRADATNDLNDALKKGNAEDIEKYSKRTVKATDQQYEDCKKLLRLMGVPVVEAPCAAESQCAALCKEGKVYAVASEDMDSLAFGAPRFLRHLMDPTSKRTPVVEFKVSKVLEELNLTMDQFIDLCILSGCDYCESIRGIGGLTALKLIRQHGSLDHILENINKERYQIPFDWPYQQTRKLFREPSVLTDSNQLELKWTDPDEEGLVRFLVNENTFNTDRISKAIKKTKTAMDKLPRSWSESYSKPVGASVPAKGEVRLTPISANTALSKTDFCYQPRSRRKKDAITTHVKSHAILTHSVSSATGGSHCCDFFGLRLAVQWNTKGFWTIHGVFPCRIPHCYRSLPPFTPTQPFYALIVLIL